ncbi:MAG: DUF1444 family protein [Candidatus Obscuribacterales bacterium]|nr:DUF1444 family protein [Candidatus Obscuribacterales bacterium]
MLLKRRHSFAILLSAMLFLLQSCATATPIDEQISQAKPLFTIKIERNKDLPPSGGDDSSLDKLMPDEIEQPVLTHIRFDELLASSMLKARPGQSLIGIKDHTISFKNPGGQKFEILTETTWADCKDMPGNRKVKLRTMLASMEEYEKRSNEAPTTANDVVPLIRREGMIEETKKLETPDGKPVDLAWFPIAPGIICILAHDAPNSLQFLNASESTKLGLTVKDMKKGPVKTLRSHLPTDVSVFGGNGVFMVSCGGDFESSLILDDEIMSTIKQHVKGRLAFGVSSKDVLLLCGDADKNAVELLRETILREASRAPRPVSDKLYYWDDGKISLGP